MRSTAAPVSPLVDVGAPEEELAATTVLVDGDRALGGELSERVAVDTEVFGCATRVQPLGGVIARRATKMLNHRGGHASHELVDESFEDQELGGSVRRRKASGGPPRSLGSRPPKKLVMRGRCWKKRIAQSGRWGRLTLSGPPNGLGQASGCSTTAGAAV